MNKILLLLSLVLAFAIQTNAQRNTSQVFEDNELTWYGLDFSAAKLIGAIGFKNPEKIKTYYFDAWNSLILNETSKYKLGKFFKKDSVDHYLDIVTARNNQPKFDELVIEKEYSFQEEKVEQIISEYDSGDSNGLGLVFIVESLNKHSERALIWVTFFDIRSRQIILTKKITGKAGGYGFRNYWAGAFHKIMKSAYKDMKSN